LESKRDSVTQTLPPWIQLDDAQISIALHVQPGARRTAIIGQHGDRLKIAVQARASDGQANTAVVELLASTLGRTATSIRIAAGTTSRVKRVVADRGALTAAEIIRRLQGK
jgi:uncharacterized protein (TIGR00251 family)